MDMSNNNRIAERFISDPSYRKRVISKIQKDKERGYKKRIGSLKKDIIVLEGQRSNEIKNIESSRWEKIADGVLQVNKTEGKIRYNNLEYYFSSIEDVEINAVFASETTSYDTTTTTTHSTSKKHISVGGAMAGGLLLGPVGAAVGGVGLGKTTGKTVSKNSGGINMHEYQICEHLGVKIRAESQYSEIVLLRQTVPVAGNVFQRAYLNAQNIAAMVEKVSKIPVPEDVVRVEDEDSVRGIDNQIVDKQYELECAIEDKPDYSLPDTYRLQEYDSLTDTEYLAMLRDWDEPGGRSSWFIFRGGDNQNVF